MPSSVILLFAVIAVSVNRGGALECYVCTGVACNSITSDTPSVYCDANDFTTTTTTTIAPTTDLNDDDDYLISEYNPGQNNNDDFQIAEFNPDQNANDEIGIAEYNPDQNTNDEIEVVELPNSVIVNREISVHLDEKRRFARSLMGARNDGDLVCITATYTENGEEATYRGCSVMSSVEGACANVVPADSLLSCESCDSDNCNGAYGVTASIILVITSVLTYSLV